MRMLIRLLAVMAIAMPVANMAMSKSPNSENIGLYTDNTVDNRYPASWYFIDTISANRVTVIIDSIDQCYAFTDSMDVNSLDTPNILALPNSYIVLDLFCRNYGKKLNIVNEFLREAYKMQSNEAISMPQRADKYPLTKTITKIVYYRKPKYYIYLLMQGKEIVRNTLEPMILGKVPSMIDCNYEAYYRVLIPVWPKRKIRRAGY